MASAPQTETVRITINDIDLDVPKGELIVESVKRLGLEIPIFCYHSRMKPVGMCRMCLVEVGFKQEDGSVRKMPKPQAGCTLPASAGMVIYTDSEQVHRDRRGVLEFLLVNHPLDCPICDRGGECPLQNNTMAYGPSTSRFLEAKRHLPKAFPLSDYVTLDLERCIQCGRCVRFTEEISGDAQLAFRFRGAQMQPSTFQLTDFESKFSGNVIEICPVGALTSARYRFRARPWDLETKPGICTVTPCGTNIWFDTRAGRFVRINGRTNEQVNEEWTADRCKFGHDFYNNPLRLTAPNSRVGDEFQRVSWGQAYTDILNHFQDKGDRVGVIVRPNVSNEGLYLLNRVAREVFATDNIDHRFTPHLAKEAESLESKYGVASVQTRIAELESMDAVLVFGAGLALEQPMHFLRVRKGWFQRNMKVIVATDRSDDLETFAHAKLVYRSGTEVALAAGLAGLAGVETGSSWTLDSVVEKTGVDKGELEKAVDAMKEGARAILTTHSMSGSEAGAKAVDALAVWAAHSGAKFSNLGLESNSQGARELGLLPDIGGKSGLNTREMLQAAADGNLDALLLVGTDVLADYPDRELVERALENVGFLVCIDALPTESAEYASVVLPMALPAEQDGTFTSCERRVQRMTQVLNHPGEAKGLWRICSELLARTNPITPWFNAGEVTKEISAKVPVFADVTPAALDGEGTILNTVETRPFDAAPLAQTLKGSL